LIHDSCDRFMQTDESPALVSKRYELALIDAERWYHKTEWAIHGWVSNKMLQSVVYHLKLADIIETSAEIPELVWKRV